MRYKLPEGLGGGEIEAEEVAENAWSQLEQFFYILPDGSQVRGPGGARLEPTRISPKEPVGIAMVHIPNEGYYQRTGSSWMGTVNHATYTWERLCELGTPELLVPANPVPVTLPWADRAFVVEVTSGFEKTGQPIVFTRKGSVGDRVRNCLSIERANALADALRSAASYAQSVQDGLMS